MAEKETPQEGGVGSLKHGATGTAKVITGGYVGKSASGYVLLHIPDVGIFAMEPALALVMAAQLKEEAELIRKVN